MKNASKKIQQALTIIRKFYQAVNVQRTDNEDIVYLFDYTANKKTVGSDKIAKAVEKAAKQQDFPKDVYYSDGMLTVVAKTSEIKEVETEVIAEITEEITEETTEETTEEVAEQPKKRGRKKQTETDLDAES